ncbi:hypothetical protein [Xenophilus azovorans]|uniref:hypothetical protein n=1 Tax=Xenophilus azovorans TaxID=151755 RepID=UPI00056F4070|nr:hypothetical protein [Xenophilus azovorans]
MLAPQIKTALQARGFNVVASPGGGWFISRWNSAHFCRVPADVSSFARRLGIELDDGKRLATARAQAALRGARLEVETAIDGRVRFRLDCADGRIRFADHLTEIEALLAPSSTTAAPLAS